MAARTARSEVAGHVWKIVAGVGSRVEAGDTIVLIESMKMEIPVLAETGGVVREILVAERAEVAEGQAVAILDD
jgi:biotin carboxyl carrier protein